MYGKFRLRIWNKLLYWLGLLSGGGLAMFFVFLLIADPPQHWDDALAAGFFIVFGFTNMILCGYGLHITPGIFLRVEEDHLTGWTVLGGKLDCPMSQVSAVAWGGYGLSITLKNGKRYNYTDLANAHALGSFIHARTQAPEQVAMDRQTLALAILAQQRKCKRQLTAALASSVLIFVPILAAVPLTDGRELHEFSGTDWTIFAAMVVLVLAGLAAFTILLRKWVRSNAEYERLLFAKPSD